MLTRFGNGRQALKVLLVEEVGARGKLIKMLNPGVLVRTICLYMNYLFS